MRSRANSTPGKMCFRYCGPVDCTCGKSARTPEPEPDETDAALDAHLAALRARRAAREFKLPYQYVLHIVPPQSAVTPEYLLAALARRDPAATPEQITDLVQRSFEAGLIYLTLAGMVARHTPPGIPRQPL